MRVRAAFAIACLSAVSVYAEPPLKTFDVRKFDQVERISVPSTSRGLQPFALGPKEAHGLGIEVDSEASAVYDTSAYDDFSEKSDWYFDGQVTISRPISTNWVFVPLVSAEWYRYDRYSDLDVDLLIAGLVLAHPLPENAQLKLSVANIWVFHPGFDGNFLTLTDVAGTFAKSWNLSGGNFFGDGVVNSLVATITRRFSDNDQSERLTFNIEPGWTKTLSAGLEWTVAGDVLYGMYDDPDDRELWQLGVNTSISRALWTSDKCSGTVIAKVSYQNNDDTTVLDGVAVNDFEKWEVRPTLAVSATF